MRLVYLMFSSNTCYCNVVEATPEGVTVDLEKKTWRYKYAELQQYEHIGRGRYVRNSRHGVIGVYDLNNIGHVNLMVYNALEAQRSHSR